MTDTAVLHWHEGPSLTNPGGAGAYNTWAGPSDPGDPLPAWIIDRSLDMVSTGRVTFTITVRYTNTAASAQFAFYLEWTGYVMSPELDASGTPQTVTFSGSLENSLEVDSYLALDPSYFGFYLQVNTAGTLTLISATATVDYEPVWKQISDQSPAVSGYVSTGTRVGSLAWSISEPYVDPKVGRFTNPRFYIAYPWGTFDGVTRKEYTMRVTTEDGTATMTYNAMGPYIGTAYGIYVDLGYVSRNKPIRAEFWAGDVRALDPMPHADLVWEAAHLAAAVPQYEPPVTMHFTAPVSDYLAGHVRVPEHPFDEGWISGNGSNIFGHVPGRLRFLITITYTSDPAATDLGMYVGISGIPNSEYVHLAPSATAVTVRHVFEMDAVASEFGGGPITQDNYPIFPVIDMGAATGAPMTVLFLQIDVSIEPDRRWLPIGPQSQLHRAVGFHAPFAGYPISPGSVLFMDADEADFDEGTFSGDANWLYVKVPGKITVTLTVVYLSPSADSYLSVALEATTLSETFILPAVSALTTASHTFTLDPQGSEREALVEHLVAHGRAALFTEWVAGSSFGQQVSHLIVDATIEPEPAWLQLAH